jgi:hypothetical protein
MLRSGVISILITLSLVEGIYGQENTWRGLTPLRSTVEDVERILGKPIAEKYGNTKEYQTDEGSATITFTSKRCDDGWDVSEGTVLTIGTSEKRFAGKTAGEIGLVQGQQFAMMTDLLNEQTWIDPANGLEYHLEMEPHAERLAYVIKSVTYTPKRSDYKFRCDGFPPYAPERDYFTMDTPRFLDPTLDPKKAFSSNVAQIINSIIQLNSNRGKYIGYALIYFDENRPITFYKKQFEKLRKFVYRRFPDHQEDFIFIEGGLRGSAEMRLYIISVNYPPPIPKPDYASPQFVKEPR